MNEEKLKEIYAELYMDFRNVRTDVEKYTEGNCPKDISQKLNNLQNVLLQLKEQAELVGVNLDERENVKVDNDETNNKEQLIEAGGYDNKIKAIFMQSLNASKDVNYIFTDKMVADAVFIVSKYYAANYTNVNTSNIGDRMKERLEKDLETFGGDDKDENAKLIGVLKQYRTAAIDAIIEEVKQLPTRQWKLSIEDLHERFKKVYKGLEEASDQAKESGGTVSQFKAILWSKDDAWKNKKIDLAGGFSLEELSVAASLEIALLPNARLSLSTKEKDQKAICSAGADLLKSSLSYDRMKQKMDLTRTAFSSKIVFDFGVVKLTPKIDLGKVSLAGLRKDYEERKAGNKAQNTIWQTMSGMDGLSIGNVQLELTIDAKSVFDKAGITWFNSIKKLTISGSMKMKIKWSYDLYKKIMKEMEEAAEKKAAQRTAARNALLEGEDKAKFAKHVKEADKILDVADELKDLANTKDKEAGKKLGKKLMNWAADMESKAKKMKFNTQKALNKALTYVEDLGGKLLGKLGAAGKILGKLIPGLSTALTLYEVGYALYKFFSGDWEEWFRGIGRSLEEATPEDWKEYLQEGNL
ncbi:MAG: hypothetical protein MK212_13970 [Saprospiraceae bacterium]|nr:hypothetical protein [Saprospiraceae bacterium]